MKVMKNSIMQCAIAVMACLVCRLPETIRPP